MQLSKDGSRHVTDEFYNTLIMVIGAILACFGVSALLYSSITAGKHLHTLSFAIYGATLINLFIASALHHGVKASARTEHMLKQFDYFAVFLLIAGSFTPFCLIVLANPFGHKILALIWTLAFIGILLKAIYPNISKWVILSIYLGMGWIGLLLAQPLYERISHGIGLLFIGGLFFTIGSLIYFKEGPNPFPGKFGFHEIWHLHVLAGTTGHFYLFYYFILPL